MYQLRKLLPEALLERGGSLAIRRSEQAGGRDLGGEPVGFGKTDDEGDEVLFDLGARQVFADLVKGLDSLTIVSVISQATCGRPTFSRTRGSSIAARFSNGESRTWPYSGPPTYSTKFPSSSLRAVKTSSSSSTDSVGNNQHPSGVVWEACSHTVQKRDQFVPGPLCAQSKGNRRKPLDGIETEKNIVVLW